MDSAQLHWKQVERVTQSQGPLGPDQRDIRHIPKSAKTVYPGERMIEIRLACTVASKAQIYVYGARKDDEIVDVANGYVETGEQYTDRDMKRWHYVNRILLSSHWLSPVVAVDAAVSRLAFRTHGYHRFFVRIEFTQGEWFVDMVGASE